MFYGHNHEKNIEKIGSCIVVNPGEISAHKTKEASLAIYDTVKNDAAIMTLDGSITLKTSHVDMHMKNMDYKYNKATRSHKY